MATISTSIKGAFIGAVSVGAGITAVVCTAGAASIPVLAQVGIGMGSTLFGGYIGKRIGDNFSDPVLTSDKNTRTSSSVAMVVPNTHMDIKYDDKQPQNSLRHRKAFLPASLVIPSSTVSSSTNSGAGCARQFLELAEKKEYVDRKLAESGNLEAVRKLRQDMHAFIERRKSNSPQNNDQKSVKQQGGSIWSFFRSMVSESSPPSTPVPQTTQGFAELAEKVASQQKQELTQASKMLDQVIIATSSLVLR